MIGVVARTFACGPDFPPYLLGAPPEAAFEPMVGDFDAMIAAITLSSPSGPLGATSHASGGGAIAAGGGSADPSVLPTAVASGWREVERIDASAGLPAGLVEPWLAARAAARAKLPVVAPEGIPEEYGLYLEGSRAWHLDRCADTRAFSDLLALPAEARRNRTTWAAFMLAECATGAARAPAWARLREAAAGGFADRWGLAAWSYGVEALDHGVRPAAFHLYLAQARSDPEGRLSLLLLAREALDQPEVLPELVRDPVVSAIVTAYVASRDTAPAELADEGRRGWDPDEVRRERWLDAIGGSETVGAGTVAWLAYQGARYEEAGRWAAAAGPDDGYAAWVRGRLALRGGELEDGARAMKSAANLLPSDAWQTWGRFRDGHEMPFSPQGEARAEAAIAQLARGEFVGALEGLSGTRYWLDAAYVAERVLTADELRAWVDERFPTASSLPADVNGWPLADGSEEFWGCGVTCRPSVFADRIRWLLARRLVREGRVSLAVPYAPERHRAAFEELRDAAARGAVTDVSRRMRVRGLQLAGTELDPDYAVFGGNYELSIGSNRMARTDMLGPSAEERARYVDSAPRPDRRYHYRFVAAGGLVDFAASLRDDDPRVAWALCTAGRWVDSRDSALARSYYREALRRPIDRSGVGQWFSDCGAEPPAPAWWWPWRRALAQLPKVLVAIGAATWWWRRRR